MISTDATYKLNYHSFPVLLLAIVDYRNHVFPVALAICGNEKTADFAELFRSLNVAAQKINLPPHSPEYIMADGAMQITNAAKLVYPRAKRCMCWFHVKKNVEDALQRLVVDEKLRWRMLRDLAYVQLAITKQAFKASFALYKDEYDSVAHEAVEYIRTSWVEHQYHSTWYEGHAPRLPSTNNGLESMNNQLKLTIHREKLPLGAFIAVVTGKIIPGYSDALAQNPSEADRAFETAEDVKATKKTFKIAALWQASTKIHEVSGPGLAGKFLFVLSRGADEDYLTSENVGRYLATISGTYRHPCFASVAAIMSKMYMITVPTGATNWRSLQCSCREYLKKKVCLHSIGIGIRLGLLNSEDEKMLPIQKSAPKRGRKRKAGPALAKSLTLDAAAQDRFLSF